MKNSFTYIALLHCLILQSALAQFSGRVLDEYQRSIQDVMILNTRTLQHTHTDALGWFTDNYSKPGDTLQFSYLGFKSKQIVLEQTEDKKPLQIILEETSLLLGQVDVSEPLQTNLQQIDSKLNPVQNSQELLRKVPGLFIAQHAGGGKAEQMFLRGFDIDHGTDISISVDHILPVNMVSHAHGQGYADLHFIIPETVKQIDFEKGSYNASKGNFETAGYVDFILQDKIQNHSVIFETGKFQSNRIAGLIKLIDHQKSNSYFAAEYASADGYFEHPQDFSKVNALLKYNYNFDSQSGLKLSGSYFTSTWNASGQIPQRAVESGIISRFGAIDPDEGGKTARSNFMFQYYLSKKAYQIFKVTGYLSHYDFELYSNFTFFLNDPVNGDQILQKENRTLFGLESNLSDRIGNLHWSAAIGARIDKIKDIELSYTKDRNILLDRKSFGNVDEQDFYSYIKLDWIKNKWEIQLQSRADFFHSTYFDKLISVNNKTNHSEFKISPKLNVSYNVSKYIQLYAKSGMGFHSNDSRLSSTNPESDVLTRSINADLGIQYKAGSSALFHAGVWFIDLENELVYVGDEAVVESSGHTERRGIEAGLRWQPYTWLGLDAEGSYTIAKSVDDPENANHIPLASKWCSTGGIVFQNIKNLSMALRYRYLGDRPANEDNSIIAKGYSLIDGNLNYKYNNLYFSLIAENIFNTAWNEAQFATLSKLQNESEPKEEIHFTPGTPFNFRFKVQVMF